MNIISEQNQPQHFADIHSASDEYAARFSGEAGRWMLNVQSKLLLEMLNGFAPRATVLDVGGGHGQVALPLARAGFDITVLASSSDGLTQVAQASRARALQTKVGDLLALPFPDKHFEIVTCFRILPHCDNWQKLISELCRVSKRAVIIDYPTWQSVNVLSPLMFKLKKRFEGNTRDYTLFGHDQIRTQFADSGYVRGAMNGEFFFPMVIHRLLKRAWASNLLENTSSLLLLNKLLGSPVIARFDRSILTK